MHILLTLLPALGLFAQLSVAAYTLRDDYGTTDSFFDKFNFFTSPRPSPVPRLSRMDRRNRYRVAQ
ncbi:hypothetical protein NUU61_009444 [Penicillium alfredii]|uniref:Secreted protein n=1 Tax=Penicillium alfredii TaxID=1506179 RepID=A0A9W9ENA6_9EURO|nr:uncharacterized protein NUU61_009444 [Penicillium alfredii]KAJ5084865.1 hypothetical protein NUU61_009444 [Penicillium alfredii]